MSTIEPTPPPVTPPPTVSGGSPVSGLVARVKGILLTPKAEWERIDAEPATIQSLYVPYVLILAAIPAICTFIGTSLIGVNVLGVTYKPPIVTGLTTAVISYVLSLVSIAVLALIIEFLAPQFGGTKDRVQAFKVAVYSWTAVWLAGVFNIFPPLAILGLLGLYSLYLLYLGLPRLMRTPPDKALVYTIVVIVAAIVVFFVISLVTRSVAGIGAPAAPAFGQMGGQAQAGPYGQPVQQPTFGQQTPQNPFGQQPQPSQPAAPFGQQPQPQAPFGQQPQPQPPAAPFGQPSAQPGGGGK